MICEHCGTVFCWDEADLVFLGAPRRRYCCTNCAKRASAKRTGARSRQQLRAEQRDSCMQRGKVVFEDASAAVKSVEAIYKNHDLQMYPYECVCGWWHLSKQPPERKEMERALKRVLFAEGS